MLPALFGLQRCIGEELLSASWHANSIAVGTKPGSAWVLLDPSRRIRVRMAADVAAILVEVTATHLPGSPYIAPLWRLTVHHAPTAAVVAALLAAPHAPDGGTGRARRAAARALQSSGMRADRCGLARALGGFGTWHAPDLDGAPAEATWTAPHRAETGGWTIHTPAALVEATPGTPSAVLAPLIAAIGTIGEATQ